MQVVKVLAPTQLLTLLTHNLKRQQNTTCGSRILLGNRIDNILRVDKIQVYNRISFEIVNSFQIVLIWKHFLLVSRPLLTHHSFVLGQPVREKVIKSAFFWITDKQIRKGSRLVNCPGFRTFREVVRWPGWIRAWSTQELRQSGWWCLLVVDLGLVLS